MSSPRKILAERKLTAQKGRGQHFLMDPGVIRGILDKAGLDPKIPVLEIGPGLGAMTKPLLERGCTVVAVEVDRGLVKFLEEEVRPAAPERLRIISGDILETDFRKLAAEFGGRFLVLGNLPYQISSPLLFKLLDDRSVVTSAVLMFQREMADRLTAAPGTKSYGRVSVVFTYFAGVVRLLDLGTAVFFPRPKVGSTMLKIIFKETLEPALLSERFFKEVVKAGFAKRRKTLRNALLSAFTPAAVDGALKKVEIEPSRRAETLSPAEFAILANAIYELQEIRS
ncbi:MAG: ribosomal RNA small subunit methyltransferase A [Deltaproteobacteria bacterium]|nr:ribosomal RNA small subunit methyltransferase A [Deltaproteobacteria bacterium]MBW2050942.1 ribosomal RNA small subunit methyltransferase A [Deltaproteobacteria bacterium]MBW2139613.1 ribosomal RNA small subunit methyltransferase A [Deltaproteobacteria bacterium]MBW2322275.1 ribosomal RNA small subunit methyltransferase A [Deltaproteobacteria bacterium]